uniref:Uncharacterized protein n=1 Tax=Nelumbo nucifera TaxID=4432 RepID=A0A822XZU9_NELNU|nr:TPA_asm: hypothetical protein HUJ06_026952 [Nelumbo nucifera]DAD25572.1 TPA_asm: hypothetical protein HUJ06_027036 [Nelumbo nucifera]
MLFPGWLALSTTCSSLVPHVTRLLVPITDSGSMYKAGADDVQSPKCPGIAFPFSRPWSPSKAMKLCR